MTDDDYKTLLKQSEDELGATPGAYCSRKVALWAMELLRAAGQVEVDQKEAQYKVGAENGYRQWQEQKVIIERQAQAIQRLEEEKMRGRQPGAGLRQETPERRSWQEMERELNDKRRKEMLMPSPYMRPEDGFRKIQNIKLDNAGDWKQF